MPIIPSLFPTEAIFDVLPSAMLLAESFKPTIDSGRLNIDITSENMTGAYSRIMDTDMAEEMTHYTTQQVISQASTSMLAQANERPSSVLQLLQ